MKKITKSIILVFVICSCVFILDSCNKNTSGNPTELSLDNSGKVTVVDATSHSAEESPVLNLFINSLWGMDSLMCQYENSTSVFEPQMIYDIIEENEFFSESSTGSIKNQFNPIICLFTDGESPEDSKSEILESLKSLQSASISFTSLGKTVTVYYYTNVWSKNQLVCVIPIGKSQDLSSFSSIRLKFENWLVEQEMKLGVESLQGKSTYQDSISNYLFKTYGIWLGFKYTYNLVLDKPVAHGRILWLRNESPQNHTNILIQLIDSSMNLKLFSMDSAIQERNRFTKSVLRNAEGGWVEVTESGGFPIRFRKPEQHISELYGWYSELNTSRRGPFIRKYLVDNNLKRTIIVDGFIFAPNQPRVPMMRELHRYLQSIESVEN